MRAVRNTGSTAHLACLLLHLGLILIPCSQSIATVNNSLTQWHFPFLDSFEKNIVLNNLLFEYLKNTTYVYDYFLLNSSDHTEEKREGLRALHMAIGAINASG